MKRFIPLILSVLFAISAHSQTDLIISEYVEGWSNNRAIELFNPTSEPINLQNYRLTRYSNGDVPPASSDYYVELPDYELEPFKTYVIVTDKRDPDGTGYEAPLWKQLEERADLFVCPVYNVNATLYHNGNDAMVLEKLDESFVDIFGSIGGDPADAIIGGSTNSTACWTDTFPYDDGVGVGITADHTLVRKSSIAVGVTENPDFFNALEQYDSLSANTFYNLGWHKFDGTPANETPVFAEEEYIFKVWKQEVKGAVVATLIADDAEGDELKYYINTGNYFYYDIDAENSERIEPFSIDLTSGEITLTEALLENSPWDTIHFTVSANDGYTQTEHWANVAIVLTENKVAVSEIAYSGAKVYPAVSKDRIIAVESSKAMSSIVVYSITGKTEKTESLYSVKRARLSLQNCNSGIYFVKLNYNDNSSEIKRIILQ